MNSDAAFLKAIRADPADDALRLIYADWLEEHGDPRAEYLRLRHQITSSPKPLRPRRGVLKRLGELYEVLDKDWVLAVDTDLSIPPDLSERGRLAAQLLVDFLEAEGLTGKVGERGFYAP